MNPREDTPSTERVRAALRRLGRIGLADTQTGDWMLAHPEFAVCDPCASTIMDDGLDDLLLTSTQHPTILFSELHQSDLSWRSDKR